MAESPTEIAVGGLTVLVAAGFFVYATQSTGFLDSAGERYALTASFRSAQGVSPGTDVRLAGVRVGEVTALALNPETFRADLALAIAAEVELPEDSELAVTAEGLLGGTYIEVLPGTSPFVLGDGDEIVDTQGALNLLGLLSQVISAARGD